jgi:hypothetical protein
MTQVLVRENSRCLLCESHETLIHCVGRMYDFIIYHIIKTGG